MTDRSVACFPADKARMATIRGALGAYTSLVPFMDVGALVEAIRVGCPSVTVVVVDLPSFDRAEAALRRIHASFAAHPLVAYYDPRGFTPKHFLALAQSGVTELVQLGVDDSRHLFGRILESAGRANRAQAVAVRLAAEIPTRVRPVFIFALEHASEPMDVPELAAALGVSVRTLAWRMGRYGLPPPRELLTWCRLLVASVLLDEQGRTLDSVADQLKYSTGQALGNALERNTGRRIRVLRESGVSDEVIACFRGEIRRPTASLPLTLREG